MERELGGCKQIEQIIPGSIVIVPADISHQSRWNQESEVTLLMLEPSYFSQIACEMDCDRVELVRHFTKSDPHWIGAENSVGNQCNKQSLVY
ncbi:hypothetical protein [Chroogloeocystis siderophila]|uniref:Uncharacterized protein n=1 Tax=Chroogloeocystis siderophila 5.2 s.c.1 TaxID=247279 RepID=A0A1U7HFV2_9CHRO|nr:hypothetical protein [Chroogloeocystis siderophila]OKH22463.1 hypothetical protein NIES1031_20120 [Chroogloeocystis siderophila 5.2 s.c.1]